ncbi:MAG TPA: dihydrolipoamide acetyltransferase family protein [Trebonia sp.]|nr:dihydrolipoamide acetyltransferase family protein [Trebonia sp.]
MASVVRMPSVLADATEAAISTWLVTLGARVAVGDPIVEIETEKAVVEYQAEEAGIVGRLVLAPGEASEVGAPIAVLISEGETDADIDAALGTRPPAPASSSAPSASAVPSTMSVPAAPVAQANGRVAADSAPARIIASPLVRKIALERGIDLAGVTGTGPNGRIVRRDIARLQERAEHHEPRPQTAPSPAPAPVPALPQPVRPVPAQAPASTLIPHTPARRAIARRLTESKVTTPHFYVATECVVDELLELRGRINEATPVKISVNDFVVAAVAAAFVDVPDANVTWSEEGLIAHGSVDVSIAVATEGGLVTPVLRGVEARRLSGIASEARALTQRARDRRLQQHELEGGTFTVSNLGMYGTLEFSAIINPPQSGILAVGAARPQPVVVDGAVTVATVMKCMLSVDHRAIDGALAARWLSAFTARVQNPLGMIV